MASQTATNTNLAQTGANMKLAKEGASIGGGGVPGRANIDAGKLAREVTRLETKAREERSEGRSPRTGEGL